MKDKQVIITLVLLALFAPSVVGFQYLVWLSGGTHFTFMVSSTTWNLTYSDWYGESSGAINGWLYSPIIWLFNMLLVDFFWTIRHVNPMSLLIFLLNPTVRSLFVVAVALYRQRRIGKAALSFSAIGVVGVSSADCLLSMVINVIYGIPPGLLISIVAPDIDARLFVPIPMLLMGGLYLSRKADRVVDN